MTSIEAIGYGTDHRSHPLKKMNFTRRTPRSKDVIIKILFCGVCHSDWHTILNEWKNTKYPIIPGHEITGQIIKMGNKVTKFNLGDYVGTNSNHNSCRKCEECKHGRVQYCLNDTVEVYNCPDYVGNEKRPTGPITRGGYSNIIVVDEKYVYTIPTGAPLDKIAPLLCAGATMYTPIKYFGVTKNTRVGIAGCGGVGHMGIKLAKSFGAEVIALTSSPDKLDDLVRLGADEAYLISDTDKLKKYESMFDLIIDTIPFDHDLSPYVMLLKPRHVLWIIGSLFGMTVDFDMVIRKGLSIHTSVLADLRDVQEVINYCVDKNIYPEIEMIDMKDINGTHEKILTSKVRYRFVIDMSTIGVT